MDEIIELIKKYYEKNQSLPNYKQVNNMYFLKINKYSNIK